MTWCRIRRVTGGTDGKVCESRDRTWNKTGKAEVVQRIVNATIVRVIDEWEETGYRRGKLSEVQRGIAVAQMGTCEGAL